jgi:hypothetical protein
MELCSVQCVNLFTSEFCSGVQIFKNREGQQAQLALHSLPAGLGCWRIQVWLIGDYTLPLLTLNRILGQGDVWCQSLFTTLDRVQFPSVCNGVSILKPIRVSGLQLADVVSGYGIQVKASSGCDCGHIPQHIT